MYWCECFRKSATAYDFCHSVRGVHRGATGKDQTHVCVISKIGAWLITRCRSGRGLPARHIDSLEVFRHLSNHDRVQTSVSVAGFLVLYFILALVSSRTCLSSCCTHLELLFQDIPQLLAHLVIGILLLDCAPLVNNLLGSVGTLRVPDSVSGKAGWNAGSHYLQRSSFHHCFTASTSSS